MVELMLEIAQRVSLLGVVAGLGKWSVTELVVIFLVSKPVFVMLALGAVLAGHRKGERHYLHYESCDRFLTE